MIETAVILAAGLGSRLKDVMNDKPKGLLEIDGVPLLERSIMNLKKAGIQHIIMGTGHLTEAFYTLEKKYIITCIENEKYAHSGSMFTLYNMRNAIDKDFLLLEGDLLYDPVSLKYLLEHPSQDAILASGETLSGDEVFIETDIQGNLRNMSKDRAKLNKTDGELVGISKISYLLFQQLVVYSEKVFRDTLNLDYEYALVEVSKTTPIPVLKIEDLVWCEIDDRNHYFRAMNEIYPAIVKRVSERR